MSETTKGINKLAWISISLVILVLLIPACIYIALDRENKVLDEATQQRLGGSYIRLSTGVTHYELDGPKDDHIVVLIHGATIPMWIWDPQVESLTKAGFERVLIGPGVPYYLHINQSRNVEMRFIASL